MSAITSSVASQPTLRRMNPSGTSSPPQRARRSALVTTPPKLVASHRAKAGQLDAAFSDSARCGRSISAVSTLGALAGHRVEFQAGGRQAREALAAVVALVRRNFDEAGPAMEYVPEASGPIAAAPGIGIGRKCSVAEPRVGVWPPAQGPEQERSRLMDAVGAADHELHSTRAHVAATTSEQEAAIFQLADLGEIHELRVLQDGGREI